MAPSLEVLVQARILGRMHPHLQGNMIVGRLRGVGAKTPLKKRRTEKSAKFLYFIMGATASKAKRCGVTDCVMTDKISIALHLPTRI